MHTMNYTRFIPGKGDLLKKIAKANMTGEGAAASTAP